MVFFPPLSSEIVTAPVIFPASVTVILVTGPLPSTSFRGSLSPSESVFASKSQTISTPPPSGSKESLASSLASCPVLTKSGMLRMISGIAFTKTRMLAESESPLSLKTSTVTSKFPASVNA